MMKGGFFYGLRTKQLSLFFIGVVCTTIVIWTWEKTPILTSLLPPPLDKPMQTFPAKEVKLKQVPHVEYGTRQAERSVNLEPALDPANTGFSVSRRTNKYSTTSWEKNHGRILIKILQMS